MTMSDLGPKLSARDQRLMSSDDVVVLGPLHLPPLDRLRAAVPLVALALPQARLDSYLDADSARWVKRPEAPESLAAQLVVQAEDLDPAVLGFGEFARRAGALRPRTVPALWVVAGDWLALSVSHAVGDADVMNRLATGLVEAAAGGELAASSQPHPVAHPLARALLHHYGRHPGRLLDTARVVVRSARMPAEPGDPAPQALPAALDPVPGGRPDIAAVHAITTPQAAEALKAWQREHAASASPLAVLGLLAHRALRAVGTPPARAVLVLYDARGYLPPGAGAGGNFAIGVTIDAGEPSELARLDAGIREAFTTGRPLTALLAGRLQAARDRVIARGARQQAPPPRRAPGAPVLVVTALGRRPDVERLPWIPDAADPVFSALNRPAAGEVTFAATFLAGRRQFSLSFDPAFLPPQAMQRAIDLVASDPVSLLSEPSGALVP